MENATFLETLLDWSVGGVDFTLPGNGGKECLDHVPMERRFYETLFGAGVGLLSLILGCHMNKNPPKAGPN